MAKLMAMPGSLTLTALEGDEPVAFVLARKAADEAEIIVIATRPFAQRRGIAKKLLNEVSSQLSKQNIAALFLEVAAGNAAARGLYETCGFKTVATRPKYYGNRDDALVMRKALTT